MVIDVEVVQLAGPCNASIHCTVLRAPHCIDCRFSMNVVDVQVYCLQTVFAQCLCVISTCADISSTLTNWLACRERSGLGRVQDCDKLMT